MSIKKLSPSLLAISLGIFIASCGNNSTERSDVPESKKQEIAESVKPDSTVTKTVLPDGEITLDRLPAGVKEFVIKNYAGYKMVKALSDPLCQGGDAIDLSIAKTGAPNLSLIFKPDGSFVQQEQDVPLSEATSKIMNTLKTKYADYSAGTQIEKLILADKTVQYMADLTKGNVTKEVMFTADGVVICEK
jgi:hypothetical protein